MNASTNAAVTDTSVATTPIPALCSFSVPPPGLALVEAGVVGTEIAIMKVAEPPTGYAGHRSAAVFGATNAPPKFGQARACAGFPARCFELR